MSRTPGLTRAQARQHRFMQRHPVGLLRDALALPPEARSALIDSLIESLDATADEWAEETLKEEIQLRLKGLTTEP
jgi:hypothetical protein